jgi:hypothetical protein
MSRRDWVGRHGQQPSSPGTQDDAAPGRAGATLDAGARLLLVEVICGSVAASAGVLAGVTVDETCWCVINVTW